MAEADEDATTRAGWVSLDKDGQPRVLGDRGLWVLRSRGSSQYVPCRTQDSVQCTVRRYGVHHPQMLQQLAVQARPGPQILGCRLVLSHRLMLKPWAGDGPSLSSAIRHSGEIGHQRPPGHAQNGNQSDQGSQDAPAPNHSYQCSATAHTAPDCASGSPNDLLHTLLGRMVGQSVAGRRSSQRVKRHVQETTARSLPAHIGACQALVT